MNEAVLSPIPNAAGEFEPTLFERTQEVDSPDRRSKPFRGEAAPRLTSE
jgi:hypothetical protein